MKRIKRLLICVGIIGVIALPSLACSDDTGEIGARVNAEATHTTQLPHINGGKATNNCYNAATGVSSCP